ncbi:MULTISPECIES: hypothetical protein [unclassified Nostoc]|nr:MULTISPECIES: hypothetical protein [unclassified Nostoc]
MIPSPWCDLLAGMCHSSHLPNAPSPAIACYVNVMLLERLECGASIRFS